MQQPDLPPIARALLTTRFSKPNSALTFDMTSVQPSRAARIALQDLINNRILLEVEAPDGARAYRLTIFGQVLLRRHRAFPLEALACKPLPHGFKLQEPVRDGQVAPPLIPKRLRPSADFIDIMAMERQRKAKARAALAARARELGFSLEEIAAESARQQPELPTS